MSFNPSKFSMMTLGTGETSLLPPGGRLEEMTLAKWSVVREKGSQSSRSSGGSGSLRPVPADPNAFLLRRIVGKGGFGEVWESVQGSLSRVVAVKRLREDILAKAEDPETVHLYCNNFRQEALTTAILDHPNIVPVYDLGLDDRGRPLLAMKLVEGRPWHHLIEEDYEKLSVPDFLARHVPILVDVAQAVAFAHSRGIIHRDLKPSQVMIGSYGEVMLMDWGLAVLFDPVALSKSAQSVSGADGIAPTTDAASNPAGTVCFMAPEQTEKTALKIGPWTDVYLLGGMLYVLLTGQPPHDYTTSSQGFYEASEGIVKPVHVAAPERDVPQELIEIAMRALKPAIADRTATAQDFLTHLKDYLSGASKRRESADITEHLALRLELETSGYKEYGECLGLIAQAAALWPDNPQVTPIHNRILAQYARAALHNNDLMLARIQGEQIPPGPDQDTIMAEIEKREDGIRQARYQQRQAVVVVILLLLLLMGGGYLVSLRMQDAREEAERIRTDKDTALDIARDRAEQAADARKAAQQMSSGALRALRLSMSTMENRLRQANRLDLMDEAILETLNHYRSEIQRELSPAEAEEILAGLATIGYYYEDRNNPTMMDHVWLAASGLARDEFKRDTRSVVTRQAFVISVSGRARAMLKLNQPAEAMRLFGEIDALIAEGLTANPDDATLLENRGMNQFTLAQLRYNTRQPAEGAALLEEARKNLERSLEITPDRPRARQGLSDLNDFQQKQP